MNDYSKLQDELLSIFNDRLFDEFDIMHEIKVIANLINNTDNNLTVDDINRIYTWLNTIKVYAIKNKKWLLSDIANITIVKTLKRRIYDIEMLLIKLKKRKR